MKSRTWAPFAGIGFATTAVITLDTLKANLPAASLLTLPGVVVALLGFCGVIYTIFTLRRYTLQTKTFAASGAYRVVRHPLYLSGIVWNAGIILLALVARNWWNSALLSLGIASFWLASKLEDGYNIARFGLDYEQYVRAVPALNFLKGWRNLKSDAQTVECETKRTNG